LSELYQKLGDHGDCFNYASALHSIIGGEFYAIGFRDCEKDHENFTYQTIDHLLVKDKCEMYHDISGQCSIRQLQLKLERNEGEMMDWVIYPVKLKTFQHKLNQERVKLYQKLLKKDQVKK
jgi:hypothetical protein